MASTVPAPARADVGAAGPGRLLRLRGDEALVARVRRGDQAAFEVLFDRYGDRILSFCRHMLGSREAAEDAAQQTFASAYAALLRDDRELNFKSWLYAIARNRCLSLLRAVHEEPVDEVRAETSGLQEQVQVRADLQELLADLRDLPDDQRAALVLAELGDLSQAEIAAVLGTEASRVKGLVFRARSGLIERREARERPCEEIRERLANLRGGALRAGDLRHHLKACPGCTAYLAEVRRQRRMMALVLPVAPTVGFKHGALGAAGLSAGAGGGATAGGLALSAAATKVAAVVAVAGAVGVGAELALEEPARDRPADRSAQDGAARQGQPQEAIPPSSKPARRLGQESRRGSGKSRRAASGRAKGLNPAGRERGKSQVAPGRTKERPGRSGAAPGHSGTSPDRSGSAPGQSATPPGKPAAPRKGGLRAQGSPAPAPVPVLPKALKRSKEQ